MKQELGAVPVNPNDGVRLQDLTALSSVATNPTGYDVVLLIGQSNMSGRGTVDTVNYDIPDSGIDQYGASGPNGTIGPVGGTISAAVDPLAHADRIDLSNGLGPGTAFARWYMTTMKLGRRVLLVPAAYGGTPLVSTAQLGWRRGVTGNLYDQAVTQTKNALARAGSGASLVAALWIQGEADGDASITGAAYQTDLDALITGLRTDLSVPSLPFIIGQMVPEYLGTGTRGAIDTIQAATPGRLTNVGYTLGPTNLNKGDGNHYTDTGQRLMGRYLFATYRQVVAGGPAVTLNDGNLYVSNAGPPTITGTKTVGSTLTSTAGTWNNSPTSFTYQWTSGGIPIPGANSLTYVLTSADVGAIMGMNVVAHRAGYQDGSINMTQSGVVTSGTTYSADTFNRTASATVLGSTTTGAFAWTAQSGTWGIAATATAAYDSAVVASTNHSAVMNDTHADGTVSLTVGVVGATGNSGGVIVRATDNLNYLMFTNAGSMYTCVAGTYTKVGGVTNLVGANGDVLSITMIGTRIIARVNGFTQFDGTITNFSTNTKHGMRNYGNSTLTYDQFTHTA